MAKLEIISNTFVFNLDADVGKASPNKLDDVELVRFGYFCKKNNPIAQPLISAREKVALQTMQPRGPYRADLQEVIDANQESRGGPQDGKVSVGKAQIIHSGSYDGAHIWIIYVLDKNMRDVLPSIWPRIDLHDQSGLEISKKVLELFNVSS